jgi:hypothetical protein
MEIIAILVVLGWIVSHFENPEKVKARNARNRDMAEHPEMYDVLH